MPSLLRVLAVAPLATTLLMWSTDLMIARLLLPFREVLLALIGLQVLVAAVVLVRRSATRTRRVFVSLAVLAVGLGTWIFVAEYRSHREQVVSFDSGDARLVGTLYEPRSAGPHPGIVLLHGSGKFPRRVYRYWAQGLVRLGFAVLVYDKRGAGDSGGVYEGENNTSRQNLARLAQDASEAVNFLVGTGRVTQHIGLFGVSQGGWVAPLAAEQNANVRFLILHSGPAVSVGEENLYSRITGDGHLAGNRVAEAENKVAEAAPSGFNPYLTLSKLDVTALFLYGDSDMSIPVKKSAANVQMLIKSGKPYSLHVFARADHLLLTRNGNLLPDIPTEYWNTIADWARQHKDRELAQRASPAHP